MFWRFGFVLESRPVAAGDLVEGRVDAAVVVDQPRQRVEVGALELGELAPALDPLDDRVLVAKLAENAGVGGEPGLATALLGQPELVEEHARQLLRGADRELVPGVLVDLSLELGDLLLHAGADLREPVGVELQADPLHLRQHLDQRHLDLVQQLLHPELDQPRPLALGELAGEPRVDRRIAGGVALIRGEAQLPLLCPGRRRGEACVSGELVQLVRSPAGSMR